MSDSLNKIFKNGLLIASKDCCPECYEKGFNDAQNFLLVENQALKEKLRIAKEALEFYADKENWQEPDNYVPYWTLWDDGDNIGFSKARQALKEIGELEGE